MPRRCNERDIVYYSYMQSALDLEHLRTLVAIADCGGFGKAAEARHISQPALSKHVRLLERGLKRKLFEKDGRGMKFTTAGQSVLAEARQLIAAHDAALDRLRVDRPAVIIVGLSEHSVEQLSSQMLRALQDSLPDTTIRFKIGRSWRLAEAVARGSVDLAFVLDHDGRGAGQEVGHLPLHWYASPEWVPPRAHATWPLVALEEPCMMRERALHARSESGYLAEVVATAITLDGVLAELRAGLGVGLLPSAGACPPGLVERHELPEAGSTTVRMIARRGLPRQLEIAALASGVQFLRDGRQLVAVD